MFFRGMFDCRVATVEGGELKIDQLLRSIFVHEEDEVVGGCRVLYAKHRELWNESVVWI